MEKDPFFGSDVGGDQLPSCFVNPNWDSSSGDHAAAQFESTLSSLVSSPSSNPAPPLPNDAAAAADSAAIRELVGRLGSICNSGGDTSHYQSTTTSCYSTPLNSPPKLNLRGFSDQAATRLSCFSARGYGGRFGETGKPQSLKTAAPVMTNGAQLENGQEEESSILAPDRRNGTRKRKAAPKGKGKEAPAPPKATEDDDSRAKRCKSGDGEAKTTEQDGCEKQGKESDAKPAEPPKLDYIRVRARRGQATDSHSLAERVRREKISERMKFLQDLVPGCNEVTGKAVMLDEIINYVQSLQRQVEFLSMKLATVNPRLDSLVQNDMHQPRGPMLPHLAFPMEATTSAGFPYGGQPPLPSLRSLVANGVDRRPLQLPQLDGFVVDASSQLGAFWELDDLQSVVQMDFGQDQESVFSSQAFQGSNHMKIEL